MTELGLNVFHESKYSVATRRTIIHDEKLRKLFFYPGMGLSPYFFHYYPFRTYIESIARDDHEQMLFSVTDKKSILPVLRYATGDLGKVIKYENFSELLQNSYPHLIPDLKLPVAIMSGRTNSKILFANKSFSIEDIKEKLYLDYEIASSITGLIVVRTFKTHLQLSVQLKDKVKKTSILKGKIFQITNDHFPNEIEVKVFNYYEQLNKLELNYEKKLSVF